MPVKKYKTFEEAERDLWVLNPDEEYYKRALHFVSSGLKLAINRKIPHGIFKYKTFEEAEKDTFKWLIGQN